MRICRVDPQHPDLDAVRLAASAILRGHLVIFPTETVYGLAANAQDVEAVRRAFDAKRRDYSNPMPIQVGDKAQIEEVAIDLSEAAERLIESFMPGPITLVVKRSGVIPDIVTAGGDTVGVRIPDNATALVMIRTAGVPIVATSANISGQPEPLNADEASSQLGSSVEIILDAGPVEHGTASTVVDTTVTPVRVLRRGALPVEEIRTVVGDLID